MTDCITSTGLLAQITLIKEFFEDFTWHEVSLAQDWNIPSDECDLVQTPMQSYNIIDAYLI